MIWHDASGWNYGKFDDPDHPRYNFAREVDYCSGACLMMSPSLCSSSSGGFDSEFMPAYYEDTDLAFKIRHAGHKVIYQPLARIIHHEGSDVGAEPEIRSQVVSTCEPGEIPPPLARSPGHSSRAVCGAAPRRPRHGTERRLSRGQVLVIDHRLPTPDRDAGSLRMLEMVRAIRRRDHHVSFMPDDLIRSCSLSAGSSGHRRRGHPSSLLPVGPVVPEAAWRRFRPGDHLTRRDRRATHGHGAAVRAAGEGRLRHRGPPFPEGGTRGPAQARSRAAHLRGQAQAARARTGRERRLDLGGESTREGHPRPGAPWP